MKAFQYKALNSIFYTNVISHKIGFKDSDLLSFSETEIKALHLLQFLSNYSRVFWSKINAILALLKDGAYYCCCAYVCSSRDTRMSYRRYLFIQGNFCTAQNYAEKAELSKCSWYPKRNLGITMHFSEIIKLQFGKLRHTLLYILKLFTNIVD